MLSIIIPTYNEKANVQRITERICKVLQDKNFEIIFVDDSTDETPQLLEQIQQNNRCVKYLHRIKERGLATAVVTGFQMASGDILTVIDADLQHPPEVLPCLLDKIETGYDIVVPSRYIPGGDDGGLNLFRKIFSQSARLLAWMALKNSRYTTDPLSGFFMFRTNIIKSKELKPVGWKILLEILVKADFQSIFDVPYRFQPRLEEKSKMSFREQWNYLCHLIRLVASSPQDSRFWKFCLVGLSGVIVNLTVFAALVNILAINVVTSGVLAAFITMFSNFMLNDQITWKTENNQPFIGRLVKFYIFCSIGIFLNTGVLTFFYHYTNLNYLLANLIGIFAASLWNFSANNKWTWSSKTYDFSTEAEDDV